MEAPAEAGAGALDQVPAPDARMIAPGLALIFDLDGVLVDSMPVHRIAWRKYLESLGIPGNDHLARMHGRRNDQIVMDFLGPTADQETVREHGAAKERLYRELMRDRLEDHLVAGLRPFLERAAGAPCGLASNAERPNIDFVLDSAHLRRYFQVIVDGSQVERPKPAPDIYLRAARELGVEPSNCIVFEDSPVGVAAARAAGTRVVGVLTHERSLDGVALAVADFLAPELRRWLALQRPRPKKPS
jgi:beta-phosphoglucomutase